MPDTHKPYYYADIPKSFTFSWSLIRKAEKAAHQACLQPKTAQAHHDNIVKLCRQALRHMTGDFIRKYAGKGLARAVIQRAQWLHSKSKAARSPSPSPPPSPPPPPPPPAAPEEHKIYLRIPAQRPKVIIKIKIPTKQATASQSGESSSTASEAGPERSQQGYRTQRAAPYTKAKTKRAPRNREPYRDAAPSIDALVDSFQSTSLAQSAPMPRRPLRTVPEGFTMDDLADQLAAAVFFDTDIAARTRAPSRAADSDDALAPTPSSVHVAVANKTRPNSSAPAPALPTPTLPSPSSSTSDLDDLSSPDVDAPPPGLLDERRVLARKTALPQEKTPAARRREARFNPLDRTARGTRRTATGAQ